ncbi:MAG: bifunctional phosphoribosylaminoimidazolecarboxamide formyltransferase/IMP cyclohydrolase [bacterium]|nr:bifunctional phosphoribosylaminoimidazolecarboxamide formyltransferase/IMP cyclohydrolase [bacterium]
MPLSTLHKTKNNSYALVSVFDKTGLVDMAQALVRSGYNIISTGGTAKVLELNNIPFIPIQKITGNPESFDGRMKTISFQIESGILFDRSNSSHIQQAKDLNIVSIDIVVCNFYPFEKTVSNPNVSLDEAIENIDVGGPTMVRAAAKNFKNVLVFVDPIDYHIIIQNKKIDIILRQQLAAKAFTSISYYDSQVARFFNKEKLPNKITIPLQKFSDLRYGENMHQKAAFYFEPDLYSPLKSLKRLYGRDLSLVNITDINTGLENIRFFKQPAAVIIKHNSPCGIALGETIDQALQRAIEADPISAFGGVIVLNKKVDLKTVKEVGRFKDEVRGNIDIFACPEIEKDALDYLQKVRKTLGIYTFGKFFTKTGLLHKRLNYKWIDNGLVVQESDDDVESGFADWEVVTKIKPNKKQIEQMKIAWKFTTKIRSNTILIMDKDLPMTRGIGSGQTSRIGSAKIALEQAGKYCDNAVLASDSFFPFPDCVEMASQNKISAIIQQGGSINDQMSIDAADKAKIAMIFTHRRAFWH